MTCPRQTDSPFQAWLLAARPKTLPASAVPVLVGTAMAYRAGGFQPTAAILALVFAIFAQIAANFANDWADGRRGEDDASKRLGPTRMVAAGRISPRAMLIGTLVALGIACLGGLGLVYFGGIPLIAVGAVCALFALLYSAGPCPLSHCGLGDVLVLIFFGFVATGFTFFVQTGFWNLDILLAAGAVGLATDNILVVNNYRDMNEDRANRKITLIVLFGEKFGRFFYLFNGIVAAGLFAVMILREKAFSVPGILCGFWLLLHFMTWNRLAQIHQIRQKKDNFPISPFKTSETIPPIQLSESTPELNDLWALRRVLADAVLAGTARNLLLFGLFLTLWAVD